MLVNVWWTKLCECFHASGVDAVSQSHVDELICGSFIQSHWPCITLWPISMFSRILARDSIDVPTTRVGHRRDAKSSTRPATTRRRCISIMLVMYRRSRSPSSSKTSSWMASNSRPSSSICSSVRRASGLSIIVDIGVLFGGVSQSDLDGALWRVDAGADHLALGTGDLAGAQVADLARAQPAHARVTDAHPAAEGQRGARLLTGHQDRLRPVALGLDLAVEEADRAPLAALAVADDVGGLEALHVQAIAVAVALPVLGHRLEHRPRSAHERLA